MAKEDVSSKGLKLSVLQYSPFTKQLPSDSSNA